MDFTHRSDKVVVRDEQRKFASLTILLADSLGKVLNENPNGFMSNVGFHAITTTPEIEIQIAAQERAVERRERRKRYARRST